MLRDMLIRHEGLRLRAYLCSQGKITIGVGRNLEDLGITEEEALMLLEHDIERVRKETAQSFPWFGGLDPARQDVILSMVFNLGVTRMKKFVKLGQAVQKRDWDLAASEMLNSQWAGQVGKRACELADIMRSGRFDGAA